MTALAVAGLPLLGQAAGAVPGTGAGNAVGHGKAPDGDADAARPGHGRPADPGHKLTDRVRETLEEKPKADFWVRFAAHPDLAPAKEITDWADRGRYVQEALVAAAEEAQADVVARLEAEGTEYESFWIDNSLLVKGGTIELAEALAAGAAVEGIHEQFRMEHLDLPEAEAVTAADASLPWGLEAAGAPQAWAGGVTGEGIVIGSLDTGVDGQHPALRAHYRGWRPGGTVENDYSWYDGPNACQDGPCDLWGHGTHTTGTMVGDDGADNHVGVAPGATWIAANCVDMCPHDQYLAAAQWFLAPTRTDGTGADPAMRPHVINNSWGLPAAIEATFPADWMTAETAAWEAAGIFGVWAAGNDGPTCESNNRPGRYGASYAVGAYDAAGQIADFSGRGPGQDGKTNPNIAAPGVAVRSSVPGGGYAEMSGTSMAAPHVSGAVALLWSAAPSLIGDVQGTAALLDDTAVDTFDDQCGGTVDDNNVWGEGRLDVPALLAAAPAADAVVEGVVTGPDGAPLGSAVVTTGAETRTRSVTTDAAGRFTLSVEPGEHTFTARAHGYLPASGSVSVVADGVARLELRLAVSPRYTLSGTVRDDAGLPVSGSVVTVRAPGAPTVDATLGEDGSYTVPDLPVGEYEVRYVGNRCVDGQREVLLVDGDTVYDLTLHRRSDATGYTCSVGTAGARAGDTPLATSTAEFGGLLGTTTLPFEFPFYGDRYAEVTVSENGWLSFQPQRGAWPNRRYPGSGRPYTLPDPGVVPDAAIYAYHSTLALDHASGIYTRTTTVDGTEVFVIEWRDVLYSGTSLRTTFSVTLYADGRVELGYGPADDSPVLGGLLAMIGLESADGSDGFEFAYSVAGAAAAGSSVTFDRPAWGRVSGTVTDAFNRQPVADVEVRLVPVGGGLAHRAWTAADGTYAVHAPLGSYDVSVAQPRFQRVTERVDLDVDLEENRISPALLTGVAAVGGGTDELTLVQGERADVVLDVRNVGTAPLRAVVGTAVPTGTLAAPPGPGPDPVTESPLAESAPGDVRPPSSRATALGQFHAGLKTLDDVAVDGDGVVWVTGGEPSLGGVFTEYLDRRYTRGGERIDTVDPRTADGERLRGLGWNATLGQMCQAVDRPVGGSAVRCYDEDLAVSHELSGEWSANPVYDVAHDPQADVLYLSVPETDEILTVAGTTHPTPGAVLNRCVPEGRDAVGLAYNTTSGMLWMSARWAERALVQLDPADCRTLRTAAAPGGVLDGAVWGLGTDVTGDVWLADQPTGRVRLVDVGDPLLADVSWATSDMTPATLAVGEVASRTVTVDTTGLAPGTYTTDVAVVSDAGRSPVVRQPLTVNVVAPYDVAVDVGGPGLTDLGGQAWAADQPLAPGEQAWGWTGQSRSLTTGHAIDGTEDDDLFRSYRTGTVTYTLRDVPAGRFDVALGLVDPHGNPKPGKRVVDVLVDGEVVAEGIDVGAEAGGFTALVRTVTVEHDGGDVEVTVRPRTKDQSPGLATLRVVQRSIGG